MWDEVKAIFKEKSLALHTYTMKKVNKPNNFSFYLIKHNYKKIKLSIKIEKSWMS